MTGENFEKIVGEQFSKCRDIMVVKAKEYATEDRLHNFKVAAGLQGVSNKQALAGMMAKHTVSVYDMCLSGKDYPIEQWEEKITDSINYLLLLRAMVKEDKEQIKPCAICGGSATVVRHCKTLGKDRYSVECQNIDCHKMARTEWHKSEAKAIDEWNKMQEGQ